MSLLSTALAFVAGLAGLRWTPTVELRRDVVDFAVPPSAIMARMRDGLQGDPESVLAAGDDRVVRRFEGTAGRFSYRTVELVSFEPEAVTFEHLAGPFRSCHERFDIRATDHGSTVTHSGTYQLRGGLWTAPLAFGPVKRAFEQHVVDHLGQLSDELSGSATGNQAHG